MEAPYVRNLQVIACKELSLASPGSWLVRAKEKEIRKTNLLLALNVVGGKLTYLLQADIERFVDDGSLEDNVDSFLSHEDADPRVAPFSAVSKGT